MTDSHVSPDSVNDSADEPLSDSDDALEQASGGIKVIGTDRSGQLARPTHSWA